MNHKFFQQAIVKESPHGESLYFLLDEMTKINYYQPQKTLTKDRPE